jgi:hypothetical protein
MDKPLHEHGVLTGRGKPHMSKNIIPALANVDTVRRVMDEHRAAGREKELDELVGTWAGEDQAQPFDTSEADDLLSDYICTLADGSILAWGEEYLKGRALVVIEFGNVIDLGPVYSTRDD